MTLLIVFLLSAQECGGGSGKGGENQYGNENVKAGMAVC